MPTVNTNAFNQALAHFAAATGASAKKRIVLVLDNAGWHASRDVVWPPGIHPLFLPPYSPELQPAEKLWPLVREALANRLVATLDEVEALLVARCRYLDTQRALVRAVTLFPWWRAADPHDAQTS